MSRSPYALVSNAIFTAIEDQSFGVGLRALNATEAVLAGLADWLESEETAHELADVAPIYIRIIAAELRGT